MTKVSETPINASISLTVRFWCTRMTWPARTVTGYQIATLGTTLARSWWAVMVATPRLATWLGIVVAYCLAKCHNARLQQDEIACGGNWFSPDTESPARETLLIRATHEPNSVASVSLWGSSRSGEIGNRHRFVDHIVRTFAAVVAYIFGVDAHIDDLYDAASSATTSPAVLAKHEFSAHNADGYSRSAPARRGCRDFGGVGALRGVVGGADA